MCFSVKLSRDEISWKKYKFLKQTKNSEKKFSRKIVNQEFKNIAIACKGRRTKKSIEGAHFHFSLHKDFKGPETMKNVKITIKIKKIRF